MGGQQAATAVADMPRPRITSLTILTIGSLLFGLALIWPPLLLLVSAILSITIPYAFRENDDGDSRRRLWNEFLKEDDLPDEMKCEEVDREEAFWINDRGMALHTSIMVPKDGAPIHAVVCLCHGYADNISFTKVIHYQRFVKKGIAVVMIAYEGHGRSDGQNCLIPCWDTLLGDVQQYFSHITRTKFPGKKKFLMGESMGGAVVYDIMSRHPSEYDGAILAAPMVKIAIAPPDWVVGLFDKVVGGPGSVSAFLSMPWAPAKGDIVDLSFKDKEKMRLSLRSPFKYGRKPRLATARELMNSTKRISPTFSKFSAPFIILHGLDDVVTCPKISEMLYKESPSKDKDIKLYKGMLHNLTTGGIDEEIETVFRDAITWTLERSKTIKMQ